ncbi:MAG: hypothetical protein JWN17_1403, partial [Frankiales bacterium]|nr:hypothetical protein [Frankiales bacterium]
MRSPRGSELLLVAALSGCTLLPQQPVAAPVRQSPAAAGRALDLLAGLRVQGRGPLTGYDRAAFGQPWADADRNGCDTRNDVLRRDLTGVVLKPGTHGCVVLSGVLHDPYTGATVPHRRGGGQVEIDHVVALADAWQKGAARWPWQERVALANDPLELLATSTTVNRAKSSGDAATWLPPLHAARCAFAARQVAVKAKYRLGVTAAEEGALAGLLRRCPEQPVPT